MGSIYGGKGYLSKELSSLLFDQGLHSITGIRNNMKNVLMTIRDKALLKKSVIETINDQLKNICQAEHFKHRSFSNFITNLVASIIVFFSRKKPSIKFETNTQTSQTALFY